MNTEGSTDVTFSLFGIGRDGIPDLFQHALAQPGGPERLARLVIDGSIDKKVPPDYLKTVAQVMVEWAARRPEAVPDFVLKANAAALGLLSPNTEGPLPAPSVRRLMGFPTNVKLDIFLEAVARDALALSLSYMTEPGRFPDLQGMMDAPWALSVNALAATLGVPRSALRGYRAKPEYRRIVQEVSGWALLLWCAVRDRPPHGLRVKEVRDRILSIPCDDILGLVDAQSTIWTTMDRSALGG